MAVAIVLWIACPHQPNLEDVPRINPVHPLRNAIGLHFQVWDLERLWLRAIRERARQAQKRQMKIEVWHLAIGENLVDTVQIGRNRVETPKGIEQYPRAECLQCGRVANELDRI